MMQSELFDRSEIHVEVNDTNSRGTPQWLIDAVKSVWQFDLDVCASAWNAKHEKYYSLERGEDGLTLPWAERNWCNPLYSKIYPWIIKARATRMFHHGTTLMLLPARTDTTWFQNAFRDHEEGLVADYETGDFLSFLPCRINFDYPPDHPGGSSNPERSLLLSFGLSLATLRTLTQAVVEAKERYAKR